MLLYCVPAKKGVHGVCPYDSSALRLFDMFMVY